MDEWTDEWINIWHMDVVVHDGSLNVVGIREELPRRCSAVRCCPA